MAIKRSPISTPAQARPFLRGDALRAALALADSQMPRDRRPLEMTRDEARARIRADYFELPGLTLTVPQAARLWSIGEDVASTVLEDLRSTGFLDMRDGRYARP